jgi:hypothetical protein
LKNRARQWIRSPWWLDEPLRCGLVTGSPAGGRPYSSGLSCVAVEGPDLLLCCASPFGRMPRRATSPGFSTGSQRSLEPIAKRAATSIRMIKWTAALTFIGTSPRTGTSADSCRSTKIVPPALLAADECPAEPMDGSPERSPQNCGRITPVDTFQGPADWAA